MKVTKEVYIAARDPENCDFIRQSYAEGEGLRRIETKDIWGESDFSRDTFVRSSKDNGKTFGEWSSRRKQGFRQLGDDEISVFDGQPVYNPVHRHFVSLRMQRIFLGGHIRAYERYWQRAEASFSDHTALIVSDGTGESPEIPIRYEQGDSFDSGNLANRQYLTRNEAFYGANIDVCENGDLLFPVAASLNSCARLLGREVTDFFPSCPQIMHGLIVVRAHYDGLAYRLSYSRPVVISDLLSSRGVDEPIAARLPDGRILAVFRGSNVRSEAWNSRIAEHAPGYKWYCISEDGGATFSEPAPWRYDTGESFYSSATVSRFFRDARNGRLYWIGNITASADGNFPRYPLVIARVTDDGFLAEDSVTVIDTRAPGEDEQVQFSNFELLQDRVTGRLEVYLTKIGAQKEHIWQADSMRYFIELD